MLNTVMDPGQGIADLVQQAFHGLSQSQPDVYQKHVDDATAAYQGLLGQQGQVDPLKPKPLIRNKQEAIIAALAMIAGNVLDSHHSAGTQGLNAFLGARGESSARDMALQQQNQQLQQQQLQGKIQSAQVGLQGAQQAQSDNENRKRWQAEQATRKESVAQGNIYKTENSIARLNAQLKDPLVDDVQTKKIAERIGALDPTAAYTPEQIDAIVAEKGANRKAIARQKDQPSIDRFLAGANNGGTDAAFRLNNANQAIALLKKHDPNDPQLLQLMHDLPSIQRESSNEKLITQRFTKGGLDIQQEKQTIAMLTKKLDNYDEDFKLKRLNIESEIRARDAASTRAAAKAGKAADLAPKTADINALIHVNQAQINRITNKAKDPIIGFDPKRLSSEDVGKLKSLQDEIDGWKGVLQQKVAPQSAGQGTIGGGYKRTSTGRKWRPIG